MTPRKDFAQRMVTAYFGYQSRAGRKVEQRELGELVGRRLKRDPFNQATVSGWLSGAIPATDVLAAIADELGVSRSWLTWGEGEMAPAKEDPSGAPVGEREAIRRAVQAAEEATPDAPARPTRPDPRAQGRRTRHG